MVIKKKIYPLHPSKFNDGWFKETRHSWFSVYVHETREQYVSSIKKECKNENAGKTSDAIFVMDKGTWKSDSLGQVKLVRPVIKEIGRLHFYRKKFDREHIYHESIHAATRMLLFKNSVFCLENFNTFITPDEFLAQCTCYIAEQIIKKYKLI